MLDKLSQVENRFEEITAQMARPEVATDYNKLAELARERAEMEPLVTRYRIYKGVLTQIQDAQALLKDDDADMVELAQAELEELVPRSEILQDALRRMLVPKDPRDDKNVLIEIRAGAGGDEAGLFAANLSRMYMRYAENQGWKTEFLNSNETGVGGFKEVVFEIAGKGAYSRFKYESGVHRVQRVPITESSGRIHTSTATVAVLPEVDDVEIEINAGDIEMEVYTASGPGGQHMQKNATAVRIHHKPSGLVVSCENQRSQTQNRLRAMAVMRARLYEMEQSKLAAEIDESRRSQVGSGQRSEKIRTYNFPQNRVTDHRVGLSVYSLDRVLDGDLDAFVEELTNAEQEKRLEALGN
jgi:peptide chain release factor 1